MSVSNGYFRQFWSTSGPDPSVGKKRGEKRVRSSVLSLQKAGTKSPKSAIYSLYHRPSFQPLTRTPAYAQTLCNYLLTALRVFLSLSLSLSLPPSFSLIVPDIQEEENFFSSLRKDLIQLEKCSHYSRQSRLLHAPITALLLPLWGCILNWVCHRLLLRVHCVH